MVKKSKDIEKAINTIGTICLVVGILLFVGSFSFIRLITFFLLSVAPVIIVIAIINLVLISKNTKKKPLTQPKRNTIIGLILATLSLWMPIYILYALQYL